MLIPLVLLLSTGSLLSVESHQSSNITSSSLNRQYSRDQSSHLSTTGLDNGHPTAIARRNHHQVPSSYHQLSGPSSSPFHERRPLYRGPRAEPGFLDVLETSPHEIRVHPGGRPHSHPPPHPPPPPPHRHNRQLGHRGKAEVAITELKDISQIPKILRAVKDRIQSMPGLKAFLLTKDGPSGPKIKPSIVLTAPEEFSNKPGHLIWRLLNSKSAKTPNSFGKSLTSRPRYPSPPSSPSSSVSNSPSSSPSSSTSPSSPASNFNDKYTFIEVPSSIDLDGSSPFAESTFPNENIVINTNPESTDSNSEEILIEQSDNQMPSNGLTYNINNGLNGNHNNLNNFNEPIQMAESSSEMIEESPRTYYYRDTTEPKGYHHGGYQNSDYLQATSIRDNSFASSPFTVNEHVPLSPKHNGWIPKDTKHWTPGAYRSAFYTPDTRLIKFTIHDRVSESLRKQSQSRNSAINKDFNNFNSNSNSNNNNNVNSNVNSNVNNNNNHHLYNRNSLSSKYSNDYSNHPSLIEESYNINEDELIRPSTSTITTTNSPLSSPSSSSTTIKKVAAVVTLTPASVTESSSESTSSWSTSSQNKATESSLTTSTTTTIKPSSSSSR
ncbi:putative uncharacterized protein DDB_G0277255 [Tetranychus urticae]|uniref:putative uncharacterized protein DDB_G0277255 n=1 Tax=Tetranychus urticae TaxID=32264 RepID=UPI00077B9233|nr:putative uncharacterized protein DDB_G0277255 [Tetranychus urticae]